MRKISLVQPKTAAQWLRIYCLYRSAFPRAERKPFSIIVKMFRRGKTDLWCAENKGEFLGFAATINEDRLILLDYFAVEKKYRGEGIGSAALLAIREQYSGKGMFVEIEKEDPSAANREERQHRKQFYRDCGMDELNVTARVFGVPMELLGWDCQLDFDRYRAFYRDNYSPRAAEHICPEEA